MSRNGHAAWSDGSAPTGNAYLLFSPNTAAMSDMPRWRQTSRTTRTVCGMSPRVLASQGGIAGYRMYVANPANVTVTTSARSRRNNG